MTSPEPHGPQDLPTNPRIVARLAYPITINKGITQVVKGLEKIYGPGLVVLSDGDQEWMNIARPPESPQTPK